MRLRPAFNLFSCVLFSLVLSARVQAQGRFSNFETPQTHPIEIATVGGADFVLVCNTPDNSVDIYTAAPPHTFVQRVPVGLGPVTVRWNATLGRFFTCNFDGDSVSVVKLVAVSSSVAATLERTSTFFIGDEPSDIAIDPTGAIAAVSLSSRSAASFVSPVTLAPLGGEIRLTVIDPATNAALAVKMPRQMAWLAGNRIFAANLRAGSPNPLTPPQYDLGLYRNDPAVPGAQPDFIGGLGTTNRAFAINLGGNTLFMVGNKAQNHAAVGVSAVSGLKTGFVQSWLMVVDIPSGGAMSVHPEAIGGVLPATLFRSINLNRNYATIAVSEVATDDALVDPTDIVLIESGGAVSKIFLAAFGSDRVAMLTPSTTTPGGYAIQRATLTPATGYSVVGPRGLAFSATNRLIFTNGRLDNSLTVISSATGLVTTSFQLPSDPTPTEIRDGRQFLYSNRFSIDDSALPIKKGGFVSCEVCHVDGRTDGLPWDLGSTSVGPAIPAAFHDLNGQTVASMPNFPSEKGPMVTQTLQGLINYPLNDAFQSVSTNAPYHWRGDKFDFTDFNEAFVHLQGMDNISTPGNEKGITDADMIKYRKFINTILHPPNPEQDLFRTTLGALDATNPNNPDPAVASGGKLGMLLFHDFPQVGIRSCVDCHQLPDGSSNTSPLTFSVNKTISGGLAELHPFESAALRNIAQREMLLHNDFTATAAQGVANSGLLHPGDHGFLTSYSINTFIHATFVAGMPGPNPSAQLDAVTQFVRQFDTGTAPLAGFAYTVDPTLSPLDSGLNKTVFDALEGQVAEANIGLGVYTRNGASVKGYWFDTTNGTTGYHEEGTSNPLLSRAALLALTAGAGNVVIAQGTPLGTERRWANPNGVGTQIVDLSHVPANITLEKMAPNTAYVDVAKFNGNLNIGLPVNSSSIWTLRTLQGSVAGGFGVPAVRHEPPRRFRVTGDKIRVGAKLLFAMASGTAPAAFPVQIMEMHLYPTKYTSGGRQIWETLVELDATQTFALLNGGYWAPDVANVLLRTIPAGSTPSLQPTTWNKFLVGVQNEDSTLGASTTNWQVLTVQDGR